MNGAESFLYLFVLGFVAFALNEIHGTLKEIRDSVREIANKRP